jgi:hypothetical protein
MQGEMYADAELLDAILDAGDIAHNGTVVTAKYLAYVSGYSVKTISDYRRGKLTIPSQFWRAVVEGDARLPSIPNLILADTPCDITINDQIRQIEGDAAVLSQAVEAVGDFHDRQSYLASRSSRTGGSTRPTGTRSPTTTRRTGSGRQHEAEIHRRGQPRVCQAVQQETA